MNVPALSAVAIAAIAAAGPAAADTIRAETTFNTGIQQKADPQPAGGVAVTYPISYTGDLEGCTAQVAENLYPRDEGSWGIYEVAAAVTCADGGFVFTSAGSWDEKGFHGMGMVTEGSGTGSYSGLSGRLAQSGGATPAANDTMDLSYRIMIDRAP